MAPSVTIHLKHPDRRPSRARSLGGRQGAQGGIEGEGVGSSGPVDFNTVLFGFICDLPV